MTVLSNKVQKVVEECTGLSWELTVDSDDRIVLSRASLVYEFEKSGSSWELRVYDEHEDADKPFDVLSPVSEANLLNEIRNFTPKKFQRN